jgi:hypothetical protein
LTNQVHNLPSEPRSSHAGDYEPTRHVLPLCRAGSHWSYGICGLVPIVQSGMVTLFTESPTGRTQTMAALNRVNELARLGSYAPAGGEVCNGICRQLTARPVQDEQEAELTELLAPRAADVENPLYTSPAASAVARASTAGLKQAPVISCEGVTFTYPASKSRPVLSALSVRLRPASVHAVVGTLTTAAVSAHRSRSLRCRQEHLAQPALPSVCPHVGPSAAQRHGCH